MNGFGMLSTGFGVWRPLYWILAFIIAFVISYALWRLGVSSYKKGTEQDRPYLSGNPEPTKGDVHIRAENLYWGFTEGMRGYYDRIMPLHTGNLNDYIHWYLAALVIVLLAVVLLP